MIYVLKYCTGFSKPDQKYNKQTHKVPRTVVGLNNLNFRFNFKFKLNLNLNLKFPEFKSLKVFSV